MKEINILGVKIHKIKKCQALKYISSNISNNRRIQIATVNPEFIVEALNNNSFNKCLNQIDLAVADGIGIRAAAQYITLNRPNNRFLAAITGLLQGIFLIGPSVVFNTKYLKTLPEIITGSDLTYDIAKLAEKNSYSIYLLGAMPGIAKLAGEKLKSKYQRLTIVGSYAGSPAKNEEGKIINKINRVNPDILLVAYGAPSQDLWIKRNLSKLKKPLIAMGVGGTFDFIAGYKDLESKKRISRAPKIFQKAGLEWLYRLFREPSKRLGRIWKAAIVFPWLVWKKSWKSKT